MARDLIDICTDLDACGNKLRSCMVDAVLIKDEQARLKAATKCIENYEVCKGKAVRDVALNTLSEKLRKRLRQIM